MNRFGLTIAIVATLLAGPAIAQKNPKPPLTVEQVKALVTTKDDGLEATASLDTMQASLKRYGWSGPPARAFVRALIAKATGETKFQVYSVVNYGGEWRFYEIANYDAGSGLQQVELIKIARDVVSCRYGCTYSEHVAFSLPEAEMRELAKAPAETKWKYRLKSKAGVDADIELEPNDFGGLLAAVDEYRASRSPSKPAP